MNIAGNVCSAWRNLFSSGINADPQSPFMRRVRFTNMFVITAIAALIAFTIVNVIEANVLVAVAELAIGLLAVYILVYLRKTGNIIRAQTLTMIAAVLLLSMLFFTGGISKTGIFWWYAFPVAAFFLKGRRWGWAWLAIVGIEVIIMVVFRATNFIATPYTFIVLRQFTASFILVSLLISNYERLRDDYATVIDDKNRALVIEIGERKQAEEEIKRQLAEKEILLREVHHRIKNNIASIGGLISLRLRSITNPEAMAVLQDAISRINSMRILYDKLLLSEDYKDVSVKNYVENLIDSVIALFPNNAKVVLDKRIDDFHLDSRRLFLLGTIINELLTNIMKYAFVNGDSGLIKITLTNAEQLVTLAIQDNGIGLPAGFDSNESKGFGLMLVKMLSRQLAGNFSMKNHTGTLCKIEFNI
jgi:two-component sensor histidine kinase